MKVAVLCCAFLALVSGPLPAASALLFDGFESYNRGVLDANSPFDANTAPNGGPGNPWWSPYNPGLAVVAAETNIVGGIITNAVSPHAGTNMVRGGVYKIDWDFFNLAHRLNRSKAFSGNVSLDWWFFDPVGAKTNANAAPQYQDFASLAFYTSVPGNADYFTNNLGQADPGLGTTQLSLGAATSQIAGYKSTNYQAQIFHTSSSNAYDQPNGWFNLPVMRTVGWHHALINVGSPSSNGATPVSFYIDNFLNPALTNTASLTNGLNCIVLQAENGNLTGYFDDLTFNAPVLSIALAGPNAIVTWPVTNWTLQFSTNLVGSNFTDIPGATSPFTNSATNGTRFFRLRQ
ncbi:MAG TPA: hypothetical protein VN048_17195 [Verrucomicrobiae bacterium]|jgi:hypothetical protein|nr:hypothetical protein [Verrucomicrobiae bacterium]